MLSDVVPVLCRPPCHCLSYTWGPLVNNEDCIKEYAEGEESVLESDGGLQRIGVTKNLYYGLRLVTRTKRWVKYIWIDALCICQTDLAERASQVGFMTEIYSRCGRVIVWLSEGGLMAPGLANL
ncbi:hypothetical protein W97_05494 [Coniosporium apollinis CBS 100218]|uniref:Heterokaryon incompatibility domain-containing protein n=1 Tax=Coniosporium apollinis (strain CBS 100218) TaxID=1168221 RepID=R7YWW3_CONA1|nr:uncharacterized protein W97_05494 [Coniosporium apollinis CBS 100218]EON66397.1 hypothetical protein W97_05494 [Coniosporium apollinis CBS 100218]